MDFANLGQFDPINWMIISSVISLSGFHCMLILAKLDKFLQTKKLSWSWFKLKWISLRVSGKKLWKVSHLFYLNENERFFFIWLNIFYAVYNAGAVKKLKATVCGHFWQYCKTELMRIIDKCSFSYLLYLEWFETWFNLIPLTKWCYQLHTSG